MFTLDVSKLSEPPEELRARELHPANVEQVAKELASKTDVGARLEIIAVVPPVLLSFFLYLYFFVSISIS